MAARGHDTIEVFISYAHEDDDLRKELVEHMSLLKRQGVISTWDARDLLAGEVWPDTISAHLESADIILLLVSKGFMASINAYDIEMQRALARHEARQAHVIPIILKPVDWEGAPFGKLQALPSGARPVTKWPDLNEAFLDIVQGIRRTAEALLQEQGRNPHSPASRPPLSNWLLGARWRDLRSLLDDPIWNKREYKELDEIVATLETVFSALDSDQEVLEETEQWHQGVAGLAALGGFHALNHEIQDVIVSVKTELAEGFLRLARAMWYRRRWRTVGLFCEQVLLLTPDHLEARQMKDDSAQALLTAGKFRH